MSSQWAKSKTLTSASYFMAAAYRRAAFPSFIPSLINLWHWIFRPFSQYDVARSSKPEITFESKLLQTLHNQNIILETNKCRCSSLVRYTHHRMIPIKTSSGSWVTLGISNLIQFAKNYAANLSWCLLIITLSQISSVAYQVSLSLISRGSSSSTGRSAEVSRYVCYYLKLCQERNTEEFPMIPMIHPMRHLAVSFWYTFIVKNSQSNLFHCHQKMFLFVH